jgi:XTP/dITP diphosphohydrolase
MVIVLATRNRKKVREMKRMFAGYDIEFRTMDDFPDCPEVVEDGKTFRANAVKAVAVAFQGVLRYDDSARSPSP